MKMKTGYWAWLMKNLKIAWGWIKIVPFALWDLAKWIGTDLRKISFNLMKEALEDLFKWENICAGTGAVFIMCLLFGWVLLLEECHKYILPWVILELTLFLISTYAYWRDKP